MKFVSVATVVRFALIFGIIVAIHTPAWGADTTSGAVSEQLAVNLYCGTISLFEGDLGLLIGLILIFVGLWSMIQGGKFIAALPVFIIGALITAMPSLVLSFFTGLGSLLKETTISSTDFKVETCSSTGLTLTQEAIDKAMKNSQGIPYPSKGTYKPTSGYCSAKPEDASCN